MLKLSADKNILGPWACERLSGVWEPRSMYAIGTYDPQLGPYGIRGVFVIERFTGPGGSAMLHVASDHTRRWLTRGLLFATFDYIFNVMAANKVFAFINENNTAARSLAKKVGFAEEAVLTQFYPGGVSSIAMSMSKTQCKWVGDGFRPSIMRYEEAA